MLCPWKAAIAVLADWLACVRKGVHVVIAFFMRPCLTQSRPRHTRELRKFVQSDEGSLDVGEHSASAVRFYFLS